MALGTGKIVSSHVNITTSTGFKELPGQVCMFNRIPAAAIEVAGAATGTTGMTHILSNKFQVHVFFGHPRSRRCFFIFACGIMAHQTIHFCFICEIK
jgi:hypothetical protein